MISHAARGNGPGQSRQRTGLELELSTDRPLGMARQDRVSLVKLKAHSRTALSTLVRFRPSGPKMQRRIGNNYRPALRPALSSLSSVHSASEGLSETLHDTGCHELPSAPQIYQCISCSGVPIALQEPACVPF